MKKIAFLFLAALITACSSEETNLIVQGKVEGLKKGTLYLQKIEDTALVTIDSVIVDGNDAFVFETFIEDPQVLYLYLNKKDNSEYDDRVMFFAEPGEMTLNTTLKNFETDVVIEGSENHQKLLEYKKMMSQFNARNLELIKANLMAQKNQNTDSIEATIKEYDNLIKRRYLYTVNFALNNKDLELAPYLAISEVYDANIKYLDTIYQSLTPQVKDSRYGKSLKEFLKERKQQEQILAQEEPTSEEIE